MTCETTASSGSYLASSSPPISCFMYVVSWLEESSWLFWWDLTYQSCLWKQTERNKRNHHNLQPTSWKEVPTIPTQSLGLIELNNWLHDRNNRLPYPYKLRQDLATSLTLFPQAHHKQHWVSSFPLLGGLSPWIRQWCSPHVGFFYMLPLQKPGLYLTAKIHFSPRHPLNPT